jgi:formylmethanofuran dehydrogenase subunit E
MSSKVQTCDECNEMHYEIDLKETCYKQMICDDCMIEMGQDCNQ